MIRRYKVNCECGFSAELNYGRKSKKEMYEIFSCSKCKNLFTLSNTDEKKCKCGNEKLVEYIPEKRKNLEFYDRMGKEKVLSQEKLNELKEYWKKIMDDKCPRCGEEKLIWV